MFYSFLFSRKVKRHFLRLRNIFLTSFFEIGNRYRNYYWDWKQHHISEKIFWFLCKRKICLTSGFHCFHGIFSYTKKTQRDIVLSIAYNSFGFDFFNDLLGRRFDKSLAFWRSRSLGKFRSGIVTASGRGRFGRRLWATSRDLDPKFLTFVPSTTGGCETRIATKTYVSFNILGQKNKGCLFAQNRFLTVYTKLKSSASRSRKPVSEGPERLGAFLKKFSKVRKGG